MQDREWLVAEFERLTDHIKRVSPSEWAEAHRYLDPAVTALPGYYSYSVVPFLREIIDCLDQRSGVRRLAFMKSAQIGATVGVIENGIGYLIGVVKTSPVMMVTVDDKMCKQRMTRFIQPMVRQSGLSDRIKSSDIDNKRKTGKTDKMLEWAGGGSLTPTGAKSAGSLRSLPIEVLMCDEPDGYPAELGKEGDPIALAEARTQGTYSQTRKIFLMSTPTDIETSRINREFLRGDQRKYYVPCQGCGVFQVLKFRGKNKDTGEVWGLIWDLDADGDMAAGTVRYLCRHCGRVHVEGDKTAMLAAGEWRPTAKPREPDMRSYHISALYSPVSMLSWESVARKWVECWDDALDQPRDIRALKTFYNTILGEPFSMRRRRIRVDEVTKHRRPQYRAGTVPNKFAESHGEGRIGVLTCAVDVHKRSLKVSIMGWGPGQRAYQVLYRSLDAEDTEDIDSPAWLELTKIIDAEYVGDDGSRYYVPLTFIDYGYQSATVDDYCLAHATSGRDQVVLPIVGRDRIAKPDSVVKDFAKFTTAKGLEGYRILVDTYKDRYEKILRKQWDGRGAMPLGQFSAPADLSDDAMRELTAEYRRPVQDSSSGHIMGYEWHRPHGAANELWDLLVYNTAAVEVLALDVCAESLELPALAWDMFWEYVDAERPFDAD